MWLLVPVTLGQHVALHAGLHYFKVDLFERDHTSQVSRKVINIGRQASFVTFVLLLPRLDQNKYTQHNDLSWTMVGHEFERLSENGSLQTVYSLPINLQQAMEEPFGILNVEEEEMIDDAIGDDMSVAYV